MGKVDIEKVHNAVRSAGTAGVTRLVAKLSGDTIEIHGEAETIAAKQEAFRKITAQVGDAGLANKIDLVKKAAPAPAPASAAAPAAPAAAPAASPAAAPAAAVRSHKVVKGETLSHIAKHYYGKASAYMKIFEANRDQLKDPDKIREGMTLKIPE